MVIKYASEEDKQSIKEIWSICFPEDHDPFLSWFFNNVYKPSNTLVACEDDTIMANLQLIPYSINFHNVPLTIRYLVGAATLPEFRKKGIMAQLLRSSISEAKNIDCPFILLLPFNYAFYRKFGWEACYFHKQYNTTISNIKPNIGNTGKAVQISAPYCIPTLDNIYTKFNLSKSGWILRTASNWNNILQDHIFSNGHISIFVDINGLQSGYILYKIENSTFEIIELAYLHYEAAAGLWDHIASHIETADKILWKAPIDDISYMFFDDPRNACSVEPFVMARAVDVEKILHMLVSELVSSISIYLNIEDPLASWNNGIFHINKAPNKRANVKKVSLDESAINAIRLSISTFSMLSMGILSPAEAQSYGLINTVDESQNSALNTIFKKTTNFMNENF